MPPKPALPASDNKPDPHPTLCENCGSDRLVRVKGCLRCERCQFKHDCYGW